MEENVALDSKKQKQFVKSIKGIKKLIVKNEAKATPEKVITKSGPTKKKFKKPLKTRGLVYLAHIPHGFYENEMTQYFKQFGGVTNARVIRSPRTGNSKGYAFVEFRDTAVAEIVAETMNNYLMGKRLIKAVYIPPEKQRRKAFRKRWSSVHNPTSIRRLKQKKLHNAIKDEAGELKTARKLLATVNKTKRKLSELGISYDFFTPVDIPKELLNSEVVKKEEVVTEENNAKLNKKEKKVKEEKKAEVIATTVKVKGLKPDKNKQDKKEKVKVEVDKKEQKQKQNTLKQSRVTPPENFITLQDEDDSDSSFEFDSDEFEKVMEYDESDLSEEEGSDIDDESEDESPPKKVKTKSIPKVLAPPLKKKGQKPMDKKPVETPKEKGPSKVLKKKAPQPMVIKPAESPKMKGPIKTAKEKVPQQVVTKPVELPKRKAPLKSPVLQKKPKFEKQTNQKTVKKQFKKK